MKTKLLLMISMVALGLTTGCDSSHTDEQVAPPVEQPGETQPCTPDEGTTPPAAGWYMRTIVQATTQNGKSYIHKTAGVFGALESSSDGKDRHDIDCYGKAILQTVFIHPDWKNPDATYFADYRAYPSDEKQVWTFQVQNQKDVDLSNADFVLKIEGEYAVYREDGGCYHDVLSNDQTRRQRLTLVDVDRQERYSYAELQHTHFNMDGKHIRTFRWILGEVASEDMEPVAHKRAARISTGMPQTLFQEKNKKSGSTFGLPPR